MPKVYLTEKERLCSRLARWVYGELRVQGMSQQELAEHLGISQQALSAKLKRASFSYSDFVTIVKTLKPSNQDLLHIIGL